MLARSDHQAVLQRLHEASRHLHRMFELVSAENLRLREQVGQLKQQQQADQQQLQEQAERIQSLTDDQHQAALLVQQALEDLQHLLKQSHQST